MFAFDRSALAVLVPLALLVAVVLYSNRRPIIAAIDPGAGRTRARRSDRRRQLAFEMT